MSKAIWQVFIDFGIMAILLLMAKSAVLRFHCSRKH